MNGGVVFCGGRYFAPAISRAIERRTKTGNNAGNNQLGSCENNSIFNNIPAATMGLWRAACVARSREQYAHCVRDTSPVRTLIISWCISRVNVGNGGGARSRRGRLSCQLIQQTERSFGRFRFGSVGFSKMRWTFLLPTCDALALPLWFVANKSQYLLCANSWLLYQ